MEDNTELLKELKNINEKLTVISKSGNIYTKGNLRKFLRYNFLMGLSRGLGMALGFTILGALFLYILQQIIGLNLPVISKWIADLVQLVEAYR